MTLRESFEQHSEVLAATESKIITEIERAAELLLDVVRNDKIIFACGNGGSAADSQHFVAEFACRFKNDRRPLSAIALTANTSTITAIGNDYSFADVFSRQIDALGRTGDVLVAISTSGNSPNVVRAIQSARAKGMKTIFMTGARGVETAQREVVDVAIIVPSLETARIQEMHELIYHAWCDYIDGFIV